MLLPLAVAFGWRGRGKAEGAAGGGAHHGASDRTSSSTSSFDGLAATSGHRSIMDASTMDPCTCAGRTRLPKARHGGSTKMPPVRGICIDYCGNPLSFKHPSSFFLPTTTPSHPLPPSPSLPRPHIWLFVRLRRPAYSVSLPRSRHGEPSRHAGEDCSRCGGKQRTGGE